MADSPEVSAGLARLLEGLQPLVAAQPVMVGIDTGGAWLAQRLYAGLGLTSLLSTLNIGFHRDDFQRIGLHPGIGPSDLRSPIDDRVVVLVDDVLHTGRTVRAAMNELFDFGRPAAIRLAVLVDRGGRELPVAADFVGLHRQLPPGGSIKLTGPDCLALETR